MCLWCSYLLSPFDVSSYRQWGFRLSHQCGRKWGSTWPYLSQPVSCFEDIGNEGYLLLPSHCQAPSQSTTRHSEHIVPLEGNPPRSLSTFQHSFRMGSGVPASRQLPIRAKQGGSWKQILPFWKWTWWYWCHAGEFCLVYKWEASMTSDSYSKSKYSFWFQPLFVLCVIINGSSGKAACAESDGSAQAAAL